MSAEQQLRLQAWQKLKPDSDAALAVRLVVVDVETTGLDVTKDSLIAIGAVAVDAGQVAIADSFSRILRQATASSRENILIHGIGGTAQVKGEDPVEVLLAFLEYIGASLLVGFHAPFDEIMLRKAMSAHLGTALRLPWLDLAHLAPALVRDKSQACHSLDEWLGAFGIGNYSRHDALADALATAQLLQVLLAKAKDAGIQNTGGLLELARSQVWLSRHAR